MIHIRKALPVLALCALFATPAEAQTPRRRALLIGIDDYTASRLVGPPRPNTKDRGWPDLTGTVNDVGILRHMLIHVYGFEPGDVVTLTNEQATHDVILQKIKGHLVEPAAKGDIVFYYFAGHGSRVPNPLSDEPDGHGESIVPADSRLGSPDILDKELRPLFNRILDRGAQLTLLLDHCYSGSGFRGLPTGARPRGIRPGREIADAKNYGPRPDRRGALVFASTQELDLSWETLGDDGLKHGMFTWTWIRAMRDAAPGEPAQETFLRAQARLRAETPYQAPVMLGSEEARLRPFLGMRVDRRGDRAVVAVERVDPDGTVVLQGGWANGLSANTELIVAGSQPPAPRLRITKILGLGRSVAHMEPGLALPQAIRSGELLEVAGWAAPPGRPLRVWMPRTGSDALKLARFAQRLKTATRAKWLSDPIGAASAHVLRSRGKGWELLDDDGTSTPLPDEQSALTAVSRIGQRSALFVALPAPSALLDRIDLDRKGIVPVDDPSKADYILVGRLAGESLEYAWIRPLARNEDECQTGLPVRSAWVAHDSAGALRQSVMKLRRIHGWHSLESPPNTRAPYRLALWREKAKEPVRNGEVFGGETYSIVLRAPQSLPPIVTPRYYYAFVIDSHGKSFLVFPGTGSVENRFPIQNPGPGEIRLGEASAFDVTKPYGIDTYFLLSTDEPLPNPSILEWDGVRSPSWNGPLTSLEQLLLLTAGGTRAGRALTTNRWSIERVAIESVEAKAGR